MKVKTKVSMSQKRHISLSKIKTISKFKFLMFELAANTKLNSGCHLTSSNIYHIQHCILIGEGMCPQPFFFLFISLFIFGRSQLSGPLPILLEHGEGGRGAFPNIETCVVRLPFGPHPQLYNLRIWKLTHGQTIWDEKWGAIGNVLWSTLRTWGTFWEPDMNTLKTQWEQFGNRQKTKTSALPGPHSSQFTSQNTPHNGDTSSKILCIVLLH